MERVRSTSGLCVVPLSVVVAVAVGQWLRHCRPSVVMALFVTAVVVVVGLVVAVAAVLDGGSVCVGVGGLNKGGHVCVGVGACGASRGGGGDAKNGGVCELFLWRRG